MEEEHKALLNEIEEYKQSKKDLDDLIKKLASEPDTDKCLKMYKLTLEKELFKRV